MVPPNHSVGYGLCPYSRGVGFESSLGRLSPQLPAVAGGNCLHRYSSESYLQVVCLWWGYGDNEGQKHLFEMERTHWTVCSGC